MLVTGNVDTKPQAILKAVVIRPNDLLKRTDIYTSEQNLYSTDVFSRVDIKPQSAGPGPNDTRLSDVIVSVEEQAPRLIQYGGGYSTDLGANGFFDLRHLTFSEIFGRAEHAFAGASDSNWSSLILSILRFIPDGERQFRH